MRRRALAELATASVESLLDHRADGRVKMFVANRALATRAERREVYERGDYVPIATAGARADCLFAFGRGTDDRVITCVPRLVATLIPDGAAPPLGAAVWGDTSIAVDSARPLRDVFTGATMTPVPSGDGHTLAAAAIFERFPVALLVPSGSPDVAA